MDFPSPTACAVCRMEQVTKFCYYYSNSPISFLVKVDEISKMKRPAALAFPTTFFEMRNIWRHPKPDDSGTYSLRSPDLVSSTLGEDTEGSCARQK